MEIMQGNRIKVDPPKRPKKLTATKFAAIFNLNAWTTPFQIWCDVTRTYQKPFEESKYMNAGKVIEPKIINYLNTHYFMGVKDPTSVYGPDYFKKTFGDFFPDVDIFGGMWDALGEDFVVEIKTTKRAEDWKIDVPIYYKLQAALYAFMLGFDTFYVPVAFLDESDYDHPEDFVIDPTSNFTIFEFSMAEEFPTFGETYIRPATEWWKKHVITGESPAWDDKKDAEVLKAIRSTTVDLQTENEDDKGIETVVQKVDGLQDYLDTEAAKPKEKKKLLSSMKKTLKEFLMEKLGDTDTQVILPGEHYNWVLNVVEKRKVNVDRMKTDGIYEKYSDPVTSYSLRKRKKVSGETNK